jgi:hypothetical protein
MNPVKRSNAAANRHAMNMKNPAELSPCGVFYATGSTYLRPIMKFCIGASATENHWF